MKAISLSKGAVAFVDDEDYEALRQWRWYLHSEGYAARSIHGPKRQMVYMHRQLISPPEGMEVDHRNRNRCDNRRCNLRVVTHGQNARNKKRRRDNVSGFNGVFWSHGRRLWIAQTSVDGRVVQIGAFNSAEVASEAHKAFTAPLEAAN